MLFTVFTPAYNRKSLLLKLYESIKQQTFNDFEWLIVDDGSTDGTKEAIEELIEENKINIRYYFKSNGGKHTAINYGVDRAKGELFTIVDSDDSLLPNSLHLIYNEWLDIEKNRSVCGITGLSAYYDNQIIGSKFPSSNQDVNFADAYLKYGVTGDKSVSFKTDVLRSYPFPEKEGVNFVFEAVVWHDMAKKYKMRCVNEILQYVNYQVEGNSDSSYKQWYIKGLAFSYFQLIVKNIHPLNRYPKVFIWNYIYLISNALLSHENYFKQLNSIKQKLFYILVFPRAYWSYKKMKNKMIA